MAEIFKFPERCKSCVYYGRIESGTSGYICWYNLEENRLRGCPIDENCTCYKQGKRQAPKRRFTFMED